MTSMAPRLPSLNNGAIGFAHRGARALADDNTIEAFELAVSMGASGLETDIWVTSDGVAILDHDGKVGPFYRRRPIVSVEACEVPSSMPTLKYFYETIGTTLPLSVDVKDASAFEAIVSAAREIGHDAEENLWLCHPDLKILSRWRSQTSAKLVNSTRLERLDDGPERRAAELESLGIEAINLFHTDWTGGLISLFHRFGRYALGWGIQHQRELAKILDAGIDAVFSDYVDRMMAAIDQVYQSGTTAPPDANN